MRISELLTVLVGQEPPSIQFAFLDRLSSQGVAKINSDISKGIDLSVTLTELGRAYRAMLARRTRVIEILPLPVQMLLQELDMDRPATTEEMVFLLDCHHARMLEKVAEKLLAPLSSLLTDPPSEILADFSGQYQRQRMLERVQHLSLLTQSPITPSHLAPNVCPDDLRCPSFLHIRGTRLVLHMSPTMCWFDETGTKPPCEVSPGAATALLASLQSLRPNSEDCISFGDSSTSSLGGGDSEVALTGINPTSPTISTTNLCEASNAALVHFDVESNPPNLTAKTATHGFARSGVTQSEVSSTGTQARSVGVGTLFRKLVSMIFPKLAILRISNPNPAQL